jgi:hypothetical protein
MLSVVTWLWQKPGYRSSFTTQHVNVLRSMVARHYPHPHRFLCVTDTPAGLDPSVEVVPAWNDFVDLVSPYGAHQPSCYRRLRAFHPDIAQTFGERFVMVDLDTVIVGDMTPVWNRPEDFVIWGETDPRSFYNGSMMLMTAGARSKVWTQFDPLRSPAEAKAAGRFGSDQGWISYCLGPGEPIWRTQDGVYSYRVHLREDPTRLPSDARIVMFHGGTDPWSPMAQAWPWVREHWRLYRETVSR